MATNPTSASALVAQLRADPATWPERLAYTTSNEDRERHHTRCLALLALHAEPESAIADLPLARYLLEQETHYADESDAYRSSLSLACLLVARTRSLADGTFFDVWVARHANFDASKAVDVHLLYYLAGGLDAAHAHVEGATVEDVHKGEGEARKTWWEWVVNENGGSEVEALNTAKSDILERIAMDRKYGVTDEKVTNFVESSWRTETSRWAESLLSDEDFEVFNRIG